MQSAQETISIHTQTNGTQTNSTQTNRLVFLEPGNNKGP